MAKEYVEIKLFSKKSIPYWIVGGLILGLGTYFIVRKLKNPKIVKGYQKKDIGNRVIATIPDTEFKKYDILILYGGIDYATPEFMFGNTPDRVKYNYIVFYAPFDLNWKNLESQYQKFLEDNGYKSNSVSVAGFSAGGRNTMRAASPDKKLIGYIDASVERNIWNNIHYGKNTVWVGNSGGMTDLFKSVYPSVKKKVEESGGILHEKDGLRHNDYIPLFFDNYIKTT